MRRNEVAANEGFSVSLQTAKKLVLNCFYTERKTGERMIPILTSKPGSGKTSMIAEVVEEINRTRKEGEKEWRLWSFRLLQVDPTDLKGIPLPERNDDGTSRVTWVPSNKFPLLGHPQSADGENVLIFFDEVAQAPTSIQNLAANVMDGVIGDYCLDPDRTFIVLASNRQKDKAATFTVPMNLANRVCWVDVETTWEEWENWAISNRINPGVVAFLKERTSNFNQDPPLQGHSFGTPRTWHKVSCCINSQPVGWLNDPDNRFVVLSVISGFVGAAIAAEFVEFIAQIESGYSIEDVMRGNPVEVPEKTDLLFSMIIQASYKLSEMFDNGKVDILTKHGKTVQDLRASLSVQEMDEVWTEALGEQLTYIDRIYSFFNQEGMTPENVGMFNTSQRREDAMILRRLSLNTNKMPHTKRAILRAAKIGKI